MTKSERIKQSLKETRERRKSQVCKVYKLKVDRSHLSKNKREHLKMLFLEAKWLTNHLIALEDGKIFEYDYKNDKVIVLNKERKPEVKELKYLSSQMKIGIIEREINNIRGLAAKKKKGNQKVGKLKFKSIIESIPLKQYGNTYKIKDKKYISIQGMGSRIKVRGLKQIPEGAEYTSAVFINKGNDYWVNVTCYLPKEKRIMTGKSVGVDLGIKNTITDSTGEKHHVCVPETKRIKKCAKTLKKCKKGSKNYYKAKQKLNKAYIKLDNIKEDKKNKIINKITTQNDIVCFQNENVKGWHHGWFGKQVQHNVLGGIMNDLKFKSYTPRMVGRFVATTKHCIRCGVLNNPELSERVYRCECGYVCDRDIHSARVIELAGLYDYDRTLYTKKLKEYRMGQEIVLPMEHRELKLVETKTSGSGESHVKFLSMNQEATAL